jgi:hypothetical protein
MDNITKYLNRIAYKFPKGYPDMNNDQDVLLLETFISEVIGEKFKLNELTVSPKYQSRGVFNPFYVVDDSVDKQVRDLLNDKDITFNNVIYKAVDDVENDPIISTGKSSFELHTDEDTSLNVFIKIPKNKVKAHYGQKTRKDTTASSNVNEFLSLYFLLHPEFSTVEDLANKDGGTGVLTGEGDEVSYAQLISLIEKDETPERDIKIGINNAKALKQDLKDKSYKNLYWTPRAKPANINPKNPSDIIIQLDSGDFIGYSNKISDGEDKTPKFNTNIVAFFDKLGGSQSEKIKELVDNAWNEASKKVPSSASNAKKAIEDFDITKEAYSETKSRDAFADLAIQFQLDDLEFYTKDFYYYFRNNLITSLAKYLENPINLKYFLNTIAGYTYGTKVEGETPCPYKLLVGSESGSTIKDVSENQVLRSVVTVDSSDDIKDIKNEYDGNSQSFRINFKLELADEKIDVTIPVTVRTRAQGGWGGKNLFISSSGVKIN